MGVLWALAWMAGGTVEARDLWESQNQRTFPRKQRDGAAPLNRVVLGFPEPSKLPSCPAPRLFRGLSPWGHPPPFHSTSHAALAGGTRPKEKSGS